MTVEKTPKSSTLKRWIGRRYGRWTVIAFDSYVRNVMIWVCRCDCGNIRSVPNSNLQSGSSQSCGCLSRELSSKRLTRHGKSRSRVYRIWGGMVGRCTNPNDPAWKHYGGRGIEVCDRWLTFSNFIEDMGDPPDGLTIERIDNDKGYSPDNCHWATMLEQQNNRRNNVVLEVNGRQQTISQWAREKHLSRQLIQYRLAAGWAIDDAVNQPVDAKQTAQSVADPLDDDPPVDFDTPAGRTHADRIVMALRYPSAPVLGQSPSHAEPIGAVHKEIAGRVYLLAVYDADVLAALLGMGWRESEAGR